MDKSRPSDGPVVAIESIGSSSKIEDFGPEKMQSGDVIEEIRISGSPPVKAPFKGGKAAVQKILHAAFKRGDTSVVVRIRRGPIGPETEQKELQACLVLQGKRNYILRSVYDPNHVIGFVDRTESECLALQGMFVNLQINLIIASLLCLIWICFLSLSATSSFFFGKINVH